jgi:hypothetical protein
VGHDRAVRPLIRLPNLEFGRRFLIDGTVIWVLLRCALYALVIVSPDRFGPPTLALGLPASVTLVTMCGALSLLDVLRRRESILLANLGIPLRAVVVTGAIPALIGETLMTLLATMAA